MAERSYNWFVEPLGDVAHANKVITQAIEEAVDNPKSAYRDFLCADGKGHNLLSCTRSIAKKLWDSRDSLGIVIKIWKREGDGVIRDGSFTFSAKTSQETQKAARWLKQKATP